MSDLVINNATPVNAMSSVPHEVDLDGTRLLVLPPGRVDVWVKAEANTFDINMNSIHAELGVNSDKMEQCLTRAETFAFFPKDTEFRIRAENALPGVLLEVEDDTLATWMEGVDFEDAPNSRCNDYRYDGVVADLGRAAIRYLVTSAGQDLPVDRLTVEAMALAIAARGMAQMSALDGDIDAEIDRWAARCRRSSIDRAVDCLESRLTECDLRIQDLADAAAMSSSHFSSVFKAALGETPHSYILRRRAEFARDLIAGTREPLSGIAYAAGFSSQAHMTTVFKRIFKATPGEVRG